MNIKESIQRLKLTDMEAQCLQSLINGLYAEAGFSDVDATDISNWTGISINSVRGVLANLVKKRLIDIEDNGAGYQIIYLRPEWYHLHSDSWVADLKYWHGNIQQATEVY